MTRSELIELGRSADGSLRGAEDELRACGVLIGAALLPNIIHSDKITFTRELAIGMMLKEYELEPELLAAYTEGLDEGIMFEYADSGITEIEDL